MRNISHKISGENQNTNNTFKIFVPKTVFYVRKCRKIFLSQKTTVDNKIRRREDCILMAGKYGIYTDAHFIKFDMCYLKSSTKYFVEGKKCGRNPLLRFHDKT